MGNRGDASSTVACLGSRSYCLFGGDGLFLEDTRPEVQARLKRKSEYGSRGPQKDVRCLCPAGDTGRVPRRPIEVWTLFELSLQYGGFMQGCGARTWVVVAAVTRTFFCLLCVSSLASVARGERGPAGLTGAWERCLPCSAEATGRVHACVPRLCLRLWARMVRILLVIPTNRGPETGFDIHGHARTTQREKKDFSVFSHLQLSQPDSFTSRQASVKGFLASPPGSPGYRLPHLGRTNQFADH